MSPTPTYDTDPYREALETTVLASEPVDEGVRVLLRDTVLYPGGGGQPRDSGTVSGLPVLGVERDERGFWHVLGGPPDANRVRVELDWGRRFDHMQQHTAQHLLTAVALDRFGWATTSFHLGGHRCDIELDTPEIGTDQLLALEDACAAEIRAARPVTVERLSRARYEELDVRGRGLPAGHDGDVRIVEIQGVDRTSCGGTHVRNTSELETLALLSTESMRGGTRLHWIAGARVRRRLAEHEARNRELRELTGASDEGVPEVVRERTERLTEALRSRDDLEARWLDVVAGGLVGSGSPLVEVHLEGVDGRALGVLGRRIAPHLDDRVALLTATSGPDACFVLVAGPDSRVDPGEAGREVAGLLGGRGGGSGAFFQGRAGSLERRAEALLRLRDRVDGV